MSRTQVVAAAGAVWVDVVRVGSAVLVDGRHLLTAAHVLQAAKAGASLEVLFPGADDRQPVTRVSLGPVGPGASLTGLDLIVLDLGKDPAGSVPTPVSLWTARRMPKRVEVFGYPASERETEGVWRSFTVSGPTASGTVQLTWDEDVGTFVGHSGGPVVDRETDALVGILIQGSGPGRFDRFLPLTAVARAWPGLRIPWHYAGEDARNHITRRAYGRSSATQQGDLFRGRTAALERVAGWLGSEPPGRPLVITGPPGVGKSAVLARAAVNAEKTLPGSGVVFHARGGTTAGLLDAVASELGLETPAGVDDLVAHLQGHSMPGPAVALMVDALDEANQGEPAAMASALAELAALPGFRVVVATRPLATSEHDRFRPGSLLARLRVTGRESPRLIDLDANRYRDPGAVIGFTSAVLAQEGFDLPGQRTGAGQAYRDDPELCGRLAKEVAAQASGNFLVAAIAATTLADQAAAIDTSEAGFDPATLPTSVGDALENYLNNLAPTARGRVRGLLTALAYARGAGITDRLWLRFAKKLGYKAKRENLDELRSTTAADYLVQATATGEDKVTRLFHQALTDQLLQGRPRGDEVAVFTALCRAVDDDGGWSKTGDYPRMQAAEHAAAAGRLNQLLQDSEFVIHADPSHLVAVLANTQPADRSPTGAMILQDGDSTRFLEPGERAGLYALAAAHLGLSDLMNVFNGRSTAMLRPVWAHSRGTPSQIISGSRYEGERAVAVARLGGREVIVSGGGDGLVRVWDERGQPVGEPLIGHEGPVVAVAVGRLGDRDVVVSAGEDRSVRVWDELGQPMGDPLTAHDTWVTSVAVARLGSREVIVSGWGDGLVRVWDERGQPVGEPLAGHGGVVSAVAVGPLGGRDVVVSAGEDRRVRVWDEQGQPVGEPLPIHDGWVLTVAVGPLGGQDVAVSAGEGGLVRVWDEHGQEVGDPLVGHEVSVQAVSMGPLGGRDVIASAGYDSTVRVWDEHGQPVGEPRTGHDGRVVAVAVGRLSGRDVIVSAGDDQTVRVWDANSQPVGEPVTGHAGTVLGVAAGRLGGRDVIVSASNDGTLRVWDDQHGHQVGIPLTLHEDYVAAVAIGQLGGRDVIVSASSDGTVGVWDEHGQRVGEPINGHGGPVSAVAVGRLGGRDVIVSADSDGTVLVWDEHGDQVGKPLTVGRGWRTPLAVGRLGTRDVVVSARQDDRTVRVWDEHGHQVGEPLVGHENEVAALAVGRLGGQDVVVSGGYDATVWLWDANGQPVQGPLVGHDSGVLTVAVGRLGGRDVVVSAGFDRTVRVWDEHGQPMGRPLPALDQVNALALRDDGLAVAAGRALKFFRVV